MLVVHVYKQVAPYTHSPYLPPTPMHTHPSTFSSVDLNTGHENTWQIFQTFLNIHCMPETCPCCVCCFFTSRSTARVILRRVEETSAYCTVKHRASASNYQLSNMKRPARDSNRRPQRLEARTLTATPLSPHCPCCGEHILPKYKS